MVEKVRYDSAFTFIYSKRQGTPAAKMENQIPEDIKHDRFNRVLEAVNRISAEINDGYKDRIVEVLVEGRSKNNENKFAGRTRQNKLVNFEGGNDDLIGKLVMVKITEPRTFSLNGILVNN